MFFLEILAVVWSVVFVSAPSFAIVVEVVVHAVDEMAALWAAAAAIAAAEKQAHLFAMAWNLELLFEK